MYSVREPSGSYKPATLLLVEITQELNQYQPQPGSLPLFNICSPFQNSKLLLNCFTKINFQVSLTFPNH